MTLPEGFPQKKELYERQNLMDFGGDWDDIYEHGEENGWVQGWNAAIEQCEKSLEAGQSWTRQELLSRLGALYYQPQHSGKVVDSSLLIDIADMVMAKLPAQQNLDENAYRKAMYERYENILSPEVIEGAVKWNIEFMKKYIGTSPTPKGALVCEECNCIPCRCKRAPESVGGDTGLSKILEIIDRKHRRQSS